MVTLAVVLLLLIGAVVALSFVLGFRLGGQSWIAESQRVRTQAAVAERELHDLTRSAFVAMAEAAADERHHRQAGR